MKHDVSGWNINGNAHTLWVHPTINPEEGMKLGRVSSKSNRSLGRQDRDRNPTRLTARRDLFAPIKPIERRHWKVSEQRTEKKEKNGECSLRGEEKRERAGLQSYIFFASYLLFKMDRYQRVEKPRLDTPINENEIRITTQGRMRNYITYATSLLQEKGSNEIVLKAMGRAINKTVMIAELIKRRIAGLHQNTLIGSTDITDMWEPLEEGLLPLETTRHVSMITITLSKKELDTSSTG
ncbi:hypothetical protein NE237_018477 [Protea cynaroides]|uniref:DNA/RNA-binding protein Alba-like domain-containing protein n=1 Tax=Protea cynaroides TaxID=273540 RepID=A0A9Q0QP21_9MAGN|nr:hypothetical protein NE237_018477 [Protea cynaroides]